MFKLLLAALCVLSSHMLAANADDRIREQHHQLKDAKRWIQQIKDNPSQTAAEKLLEELEKLKKNQNVFYAEDGRDTSFYHEVNRLIDGLLTDHSPWLFEKMYGAEGRYSKYAEEDVRLIEQKIRETIEPSTQPGSHIWFTYQNIVLRYAFTETGLKYLERLLATSRDRFSQTREVMEKARIEGNDSSTMAFRACKLYDRLLELSHVKDRISPGSLYTVAALKGSFGDSEGVEEISVLLQKRNVDVITVGGSQQISLVSLLAKLRDQAKERRKLYPALAAFGRITEEEVSDRWVGGGAKGIPILMKDGFILTYWQNASAQGVDDFSGVVVLNPQSLRPVSSLRHSSDSFLFPADGESFWLSRRDRRSVQSLVLYKYHPENHSMTPTELSITVGETALHGPPLQLSHGHGLLVPIFGDVGVKKIEPAAGLVWSWTAASSRKSDEPFVGGDLRGRYVAATPAIHSATGNVLIGGLDGQVYLISQHGKLLAQLPADAEVEAVDFLSDGTPVVLTRETLFWLRRQTDGKLSIKHSFRVRKETRRFAVLSDDTVVVPVAAEPQAGGRPVESLVWLKEGVEQQRKDLSVYSVTALKGDRVFVTSIEGWFGWINRSGELEHSARLAPSQNARPGLYPISMADEGMIFNDDMGYLHWVSTWQNFRDSVLTRATELGLLYPR